MIFLNGGNRIKKIKYINYNVVFFAVLIILLLKIVTKDSHYLIFLFIGNNKNSYITFYGNERLYDIKDYELIIELKEMLEDF